MTARVMPLLIGLSLAFFLIALSTTALTFETLCGGGASPAGLFQAPSGSLDAWAGWRILLLGILGMIFVPHLSFGWMANMLYGLSLAGVCLKRYRLASLGAIAGLVVGIGGTLWTQTHGLPADEAGYCYLYLNQLNLGFWAWILAQAVIAVAAIASWLQMRSQGDRVSV